MVVGDWVVFSSFGQEEEQKQKFGMMWGKEKLMPI